MHAGAQMVLVLTTTLVHLAVLGSGALFAQWRIEEQVSIEGSHNGTRFRDGTWEVLNPAEATSEAVITELRVLGKERVTVDSRMVEDDKMPEVTFQRRGGSRARRYWGKVHRGIKNFKRRRRARRKASMGFAKLEDDIEMGKGKGGGGGDGGDVDAYTRDLNMASAEFVQARRRARGEDAKVKMLILMSDTGGGHRASGQALEAALEELHPGHIEVTMVDIFTEHSRWPYSQSVPAYQYAAKNPIVWRAMYEYARFPPTRYLNGKMLAFQNFGRFKEAMQTYTPDVVVSVHPLCQDLPLKVLNSMGPGRKRELPFVTVVTDLGGAHPTWFNSEVDKVFIASDAVMRVAFREGLSAAQVHQLGLPIRPAFWKDSRPKDELRAELGLETEPPVAMIMGGGDGVGGMGAIATSVIETLGKEIERSQVVIICGKNQAVKRELEERDWPENVRVVVNGFVSNMDEWMGAVDTLVTKAGPGTIAEATIRGLPVMLSGYLPGQEEGNVPYVVNGGFGAYSKKPKEIGRTVARWIKDPEILEKMKHAALRAARPRASYDIAREISRMLFMEEDVGDMEKDEGERVEVEAEARDNDGFVFVDAFSAAQEEREVEFPIPGEGAAVAAARAAAAGSSSKAWHATDHPSKGGWGATLHNEDMLSAMSFSEDSTNTNNVEVSGIEGWAAGAEAVVAGAGNSDSMPGRVETIVL